MRNTLAVAGTVDIHFRAAIGTIGASRYERMEIIVSAMSEQEGVTEALKAADQMELP